MNVLQITKELAAQVGNLLGLDVDFADKAIDLLNKVRDKLEAELAKRGIKTVFFLLLPI